MNARSLRSSCLVAALFFRAPAVLGAPPVGAPAELHGPIDPCTVANYAETDVLCELCPLTAADSEACGRRLGGLGYSKKCATHEQTALRGEVWCKSKRVAAAPKTKPEETQSVLRWVVLAGAALLAGGLVYFRRDRAKGSS